MKQPHQGLFFFKLRIFLWQKSYQKRSIKYQIEVRGLLFFKSFFNDLAVILVK
jgi:hypothetical protein